MARASDPKIDRIKGIAFFADADKEALDHLASAADEVTVAAGTVLTTEGGLLNEAYVIMSGSVEVLVGGEIVAEIPAGEMIGELSLLAHRPTSSATVRTKTESALLVIPHNRFDEILDDNPGFTKAIAKQLATRLQKMDELFEEK